MGLFDKLFTKKICSVCGGEIGLLGNRKLEDGNLCKECAGKLSPWFSDRRNSTVEEIKEQLAYREANRAEVAAFRTTRTFGTYTKLLLDEDARKLMVTSARDLAEANPDVISFSDVTGCTVDISEDSDEEKRTDANGNEVSYNPPHFVYSYDFYVIINVNNPYFDEIKFKLNSSSIEVPVIGRGNPRPELKADYRECKAMGEEIKEALLGAREQVREEAAAAAAPKAAVTCPYCGATTTPDASGCCEYCGGAVNA